MLNSYRTRMTVSVKRLSFINFILNEVFLSNSYSQQSASSATINLKTSHFPKSLLTIIFSLLLAGNTFATDYYQRQSGNWNSSSTWTTSNAWLSTSNTGTYPQAGDNVYIYNNGNLATITLTADAQCANLIFYNSSTSGCVIAMGNYNLTISGVWTTDWGSDATITQGTGYLQINGGVGTISPNFNVAKTISNLRVGSGSFTKGGTATLTVTGNYDYNCFQSSVPTGIDASSATKHNATPCTPSLSATALTNFGTICTGTTAGPNSFTISGLALTSANVTVGTLTGFSYSTTASGTYTSTLSLAQSGGNYSQVVYVKFSPIYAISYNGNIVVGGGGASAINVTVVGSGAGSVAPTVASPTATNITSSSASLGGTITIDGCSSQSVTERGIYYSTTNGFANGTGTKVSETGTFGTGAFSINVTGLAASTTYYYKAFATNSAGTGYSSQGTFNNASKTYYSRQSGNWTDPSTWLTDNCGGTVNAGTYPGSGDNVVICQQHNITVNTSGLSCNTINMEAYLVSLILNNDFTVNGNLTLANQSYVSEGAYNLTIKGDFSILPYGNSGYYSRIDYSSGTITIGGNISVLNSGLPPFNCTGSGWLIMSGTSKTFTVSNDFSVPYFKQPASSFTKAGANALTISTVFDRNCGPAPTVSAGTFAVSGSTINSSCNPTKLFRSLTSGNWSATTTWQQSTDNGVTWVTAASAPVITDGSVTIQSGHTVTLGAAAGASSLTINGSLDLSTYALSGTGTLTVASGGALLVGSTSNFPTGFSTITLSTNSLANYYANANQTVSPRTYNNLTLSGSGTKTTTGVTVTGTLSLEGTSTTSGTIVTNVASTTLQYKGTPAQNITDNVFLGNKTYNLTIANASGVDLNTNFTANNALTVNSGTFLTIQPAQTLTVGGTVTNLAGTSGIVIKASPTLANGSLIFSQPSLNPSVSATVEMYSKASWNLSNPTGNKYKWQFFGIPVRSVATASPTFDGAYIRQFHENDIPAHWEQLNNGSSLSSFTGYEITQEAATTYIFRGQLENSDYPVTQQPYTSTATNPGQSLIGNPYTAAIDISKIVFGSKMIQTVYMYNTGTYLDWQNNASTPTDSIFADANPGQYTSVPQALAGSAGLQHQIPSMQAFLVRAISLDAAATVSIPYSTAVVSNSVPQRIRATTNPASATDKVWTRIDVKGTHFSDRMWIFTEPGCTHGFDNGWDGEKIMGSLLTPQLFAMEADGDYQVDAVNDMNNTRIGFQTGEDSDYTLTFTHSNITSKYDCIYLIDSVENKIVDITESGSTYTFFADPAPTAIPRFNIITRNYEKNATDKNSQIKLFYSGKTIFVENLSNRNGELSIYDLIGHCLKKVSFGTGVMAIPVNYTLGVYVVNATTGKENATKKLIVR